MTGRLPDGASDEVVVARVGRPHGLRGEVTVEVHTDEPERRFVTGRALTVRRPAGGPAPSYPSLTVDGSRWHQGTLLLRFAELADRSAAEAARGLLLTVPVDPDESPEDPEEFYDHQLVGLAVVTTDGAEVGTVSDVLHSGAQDLLVVRRDGRDVLVPFVEALVPQVDIAAGRVVVADRPGLLDPEEQDVPDLRIDVVTIFPAYLEPLTLSLPGRARAKGLLDLEVHDLRQWTRDRHRTVDDTPYGGGAGMVMRPEPWGEALDALAGDGTVLVVPTPSGRPLTQALAAELATQEHLLVACGRYEGIDQRVVDHAATRMRVVEVSLGDYVLNGGEVAALAIVEAVARLLPGFMGNEESLAEESHGETGLLEYPVYTKPETWRGLDVPDVLRSGDHARIAAWRREQARRRTAERRPDLLPASQVDDIEVRPAVRADAGELLTLQRACWVQEALDNDMLSIPALHESYDDVVAWLGEWSTLVARSAGRLVGAARGRREGDAWDIGRLMVAPDLQGRGLGRRLLVAVEDLAPDDVTSYLLFTGALSARNQRLYKKAGYSLRGEQPGVPGAVLMTKPRRPR